jgi:hypothetical protein
MQTALAIVDKKSLEIEKEAEMARLIQSAAR